MSEQQGEPEPRPSGPTQPSSGPTRRSVPPRSGWLLGGTATVTAIGLSIAALVVALDNRPASPGVRS